MSFAGLKPKTFNAAELQKAAEAAQEQVIQRGSPKSFDPINFPVWQIPAGKKVLIYVPNHKVQTEDGYVVRHDHAYAHNVLDGSAFRRIRSLSGLNLDGYSGNCPLSEASPVCFELANLLAARDLAKVGLSIDTRDNEDVKAAKRKRYQENVVGNISEYWTFPIVVTEYLEDGKTLASVRNDKGQPVPDAKVYWLVAGKTVWDNMHTALDSIESDEDDENAEDGDDRHIAGKAFIFNSLKVENLRDAPRSGSFAIRAKGLSRDGSLEKSYDKITEDWTPAKSIETVIQNAYYPEEDLRNYVEGLMAPVHAQIAVLKDDEEPAADGAGELVLGQVDSSAPAEIESAPAAEAASTGLELDGDDEDAVDEG